MTTYAMPDPPPAAVTTLWELADQIAAYIADGSRP